MKKALLVSALLLLNASVAAQTIVSYKQLQWQINQPSVTALDIGALQNQPPQVIERQLAVFTPVQKIWLRKRLLEQLSRRTHPTLDQRQWVEQQTRSHARLLATSQDNERSAAEPIADIAAHAKALQAVWHSVEIADNWLQVLDTTSFSWQQLNDQLAALDYRQTAVNQFVSNLTQSRLTDLVSSLLEQRQSGLQPSNLLLARLAQKTENHSLQSALLNWLWQRPADQYSIEMLQKLPQGDDPVNNILNLQNAAGNNRLTSLSFNLLARYYGDRKVVIDYLFKHLEQPKSGQLAAAALAGIGSAEVKNRLAQGSYSPNPVIRRACLMALKLIDAKE